MTLERDLVEAMDLLTFTFSSDFLDKWKFKFGQRLPSLLQIKLLKSLDSRKPLKIQSLHKFLVVDSGFNTEIVEAFLEDIEYDLYSPMIQGSLKDLELHH